MNASTPTVEDPTARAATSPAVVAPVGSFVELDVTGMTCASCAARIEKKLNKLDGVSAVVNFATERASVTASEDIPADRLIEAVRSAGYDATVVPPRHPAPDHGGPEQAGHADHAGAGHDHGGAADWRNRVIVAIASAVPVILLSMIPALQFPGWQWLSLMLTWPVVTYAAWPIHKATWINLRHGQSTMDTLVSLGVAAAFGWSLVALFAGPAGMIGMRHGFDLLPTRGDPLGEIYLEAAAGVVAFIGLGRYLEARSKRSAGAALRALLSLGGSTARLVHDHDGQLTEEELPVDRLTVGDLFRVRPGEAIATDGVVVDGRGAVDTAMITGEPVPADVGPGDPVIGGTVAVDGLLLIRATRVGADTQLARIADLVERAQAGKARAQRLADRISAVFVPGVIGLAVITLIAWLLAGSGIAPAFTAAVAVLIIACPCALGLATPVAFLAGTGRGAQLGIVIKSPQVLETAGKLDTVVLDKTGTLTTGRLTVTRVITFDDTDPDQLIMIAASAESGSVHPVGRALARRAGGPPYAIEDFAAEPGLGIRARVAAPDGRHEVLVGRPAFVRDQVGLTGDHQQSVGQLEATGATVAVVAWDGIARGVIGVSDALVGNARADVDDLRRLGLTPLLVTGDNEHAARRVADQLGIDRVHAGVLPQDKLIIVRQLQEGGHRVAMIGDGVNDTAALAQADLGLAIGTGTDAAIEAGDITLVRGELSAAVDAIRLSRRTLRIIRQNLFWAFAYNCAAIPLAALGLLNPMFAGAAMAFSSVFVVTNSLRLRRFS